MLQPEYRYWFCESFNGWFLGVHAMGGEFNVGHFDFPGKIFEELKDYRYEAGLPEEVLQLVISGLFRGHWNFEASAWHWLRLYKYDKFKCGDCGEKLKSKHKHYFGPTKQPLVLYIFFKENIFHFGVMKGYPFRKVLIHMSQNYSDSYED